eukprot:3059994-Prymnesium_polylepis.3
MCAATAASQSHENNEENQGHPSKCRAPHARVSVSVPQSFGVRGQVPPKQSNNLRPAPAQRLYHR